MGYKVFPDVNRLGRPKAVTSIPILLGHYRLLLCFVDSLPGPESGECVLVSQDGDWSTANCSEQHRYTCRMPASKYLVIKIYLLLSKRLTKLLFH